jgi:hypothetical protein
MQYYLIQKVRWLFNSFLTKMLNRSTNVALAGNVTAMCSSGFETQNLKYRTNDDSRKNVE